MAKDKMKVFLVIRTSNGQVAGGPVVTVKTTKNMMLDTWFVFRSKKEAKRAIRNCGDSEAPRLTQIAEATLTFTYDEAAAATPAPSAGQINEEEAGR